MLGKALGPEQPLFQLVQEITLLEIWLALAATSCSVRFRKVYTFS